MFSETVEWTGAEHLLAQRAATPDVAQRIVAAGRRARAHGARSGRRHSRAESRARRTRRAASRRSRRRRSARSSKGGRAADPRTCWRPAQRPRGRDSILMDTPFFSPESMTAMVAGGAQHRAVHHRRRQQLLQPRRADVEDERQSEASRATDRADRLRRHRRARRQRLARRAGRRRRSQRLLDVASGALTFGEIVGEGGGSGEPPRPVDLTVRRSKRDATSIRFRNSRNTRLRSSPTRSTSSASSACFPASKRAAVGQGRVVGRALPVRLQPKSNDPSAYRFGGGVGKPLEQVLQTMQDGDIVVMDLGGSDRAVADRSSPMKRRGVRAPGEIRRSDRAVRAYRRPGARCWRPKC